MVEASPPRLAVVRAGPVLAIEMPRKKGLVDLGSLPVDHEGPKRHRGDRLQCDRGLDRCRGARPPGERTMGGDEDGRGLERASGGALECLDDDTARALLVDFAELVRPEGARDGDVTSEKVG